ncbi:MAG: hypothetical protein IJD61_01520, partial [Clostridia bacterium]|nr:hypothetical protein [Clostridia bacterium]
YDVKILADKGEVIEQSIPVRGGTVGSAVLTTKETVTALVPKNAKLEERREVPELIEAPVSGNSAVGRIVYTLEGETVGVVELVCACDVPRAKTADYVKQALKEWLHC